MPVQIEEMEDYKIKYKNLKRKLKILIYENECFQEELSKANRALLRVRQDKSFLLDQLLPHHQPPASSSDSDLTDNSDNETTTFNQAIKRKRLAEPVSGGAAAATVAAGGLASLSQISSPGGSRSLTSIGKLVSKPAAGGSSSSSKPLTTSSAGSKPSSSTLVTAAPPSAGKKKATAGLPVMRAAAKQAGRSNSNKQRRPPQKLLKSQLPQAGVRGAGSGASVDSTALERELSREEVERHLMARQTITDFNTPVSLTLPHQLFSDNLLDGDILGEEIETSPSNIDEDITVDNCD